MPALNEEEALRSVLPRIDRSLFKDIIVCDGNSTDGTMAYCESVGIRAVRQKGQGLPAAYATALELSTADAVILFAPDGNSLPESLPELCAKVLEGYDMVVASRYYGDAVSHDDDAITAFGNWMFTRIINLLFRANYTDTLVAFRCIRREALDRLRLPEMTTQNWVRRKFERSNSWETGSSIRAAKLGFKVAEIGASEPKRIGGVNKERFEDSA